MIALDTNFLVRYLVEDDERQSARVHRFLIASRNSGEAVYISCVVLCEAAWVLRSTFAKSKAEILGFFEEVLNTDIFEVEAEDSVRSAIHGSRNSKGDFADHLLGELNLAMGCRYTVTFDRDLRALPAFRVL